MPLHITGASRLLLGFVIGLVFGFLLHEGRLNRYEVIVNFFRLKDGRMIKVMLSAILVGAVGIYFFREFGWVELHVKDTLLAANVIGGIIMGIGMVVLGYCPGTGIAAAGSGSIHAIVGIIGALAGVALYAEVYQTLQTNVLTWGSRGALTLSDLFGVSPWVVIALLVPFVVMLLIIIELAGRLGSYKKAAAETPEAPPPEQ